jgi:hypothetical protein
MSRDTHVSTTAEHVKTAAQINQLLRYVNNKLIIERIIDVSAFILRQV